MNLFVMPNQSHETLSLFLYILLLTCQCRMILTKCQSLSILNQTASHATSFQTYIVHVLPPNNTEDISEEQLNLWHMSFLPNTTLDSGEPRLLFSYQHVISGFAARLKPDELKEVQKMDGFMSAYPEKRRSLQTTYTPNFLNLDSWQSVWKSSNYGEGVIIGILDSGVVHTHPSFADDGMPEPPIKWRGCCMVNTKKCNPWVPTPCNKKLLGAMSFTPSGSLKDKIGHGTHVASTAAGNFVDDANVLGQAKGTASGMAPRAHLASYKVCATADTCHDKQILAGMDQGIKDGVDVLSLSIGFEGHEKLYESSIAKAGFQAMSKGIIVSCCAGNYGPGPSTISNDAPWLLTVGASSIDRSVVATVTLGNGMEFDGESAYQPEDWDSPMMPIEYPGVVDTDVKLACQKVAFDDIDIKGKIVLCGFGLNDNIEKGKLVKAAGGKALIILNQKWNGFTIYNEPHVLPAAHLNHNDSLELVNYFKTENNPTATITFKGTQLGKRRAPAVADFSSRGPSLVNGGILKPDIVGPGVNILAAWHEEVGPNPSDTTDKIFNFARGCSMATPHLAGIAALLKSSHPDWSPAAIKSAIMTTAHTIDRQGKPIYDESSVTQKEATFYDMGAGHVDPSKANDPGLIYNITRDQYIGYLCGMGYSPYQIVLITITSFDCSKLMIPPEQLNYPSISLPGLSTLLSSKYAATSISANRTATNVGEANSIYTAQVEEPEGLSITVTPNTLQFSSVGEEQSFTVEVKSKGKGAVKGKYAQGQLIWKSDKHSVRSPIVVY